MKYLMSYITPLLYNEKLIFLEILGQLQQTRWLETKAVFRYHPSIF